MQETNYVLVTIFFSETELISVYISFTTEKTIIFLYLLDLAFIPLEDRKLLKIQIQKH